LAIRFGYFREAVPATGKGDFMSEYSRRREAVTQAQKNLYDFMDERVRRRPEEGDEERYRNLWAEFDKAQKHLDGLFREMARAFEAFLE
jgi:galactokinase